MATVILRRAPGHVSSVHPLTRWPSRRRLLTLLRARNSPRPRRRSRRLPPPNRVRRCDPSPDHARYESPFVRMEIARSTPEPEPVFWERFARYPTTDFPPNSGTPESVHRGQIPTSPSRRPHATHVGKFFSFESSYCYSNLFFTRTVPRLTRP